MFSILAILTALSPGISPQSPLAAEAEIRAAIGQIEPAQLERTVRDLVRFETRHVLSSTTDRQTGTGAARKYLEARFRELIPDSGGRLSVESQSYEVGVTRRGMPRKLDVVDVVATLKGVSDPDRIYVVGGHYDSRNGNGSDGENPAPGANDDGSGTAAVIEACRVMCGMELAATVMFVCYDGEELGLLGSRAHAEKLAEDQALVDGMITNDIVGNSMGMDGVRRDTYVRCFSYSPRGDDSSGRSLARAARRAARLVPDFDVKLIYRGDRFGRGGDHRPFYQQGFPALRFTEPREDFSRQHQNITERDGKPYGDLPDYMDFDYLAKVTAVNVSLLTELALAPPAPATVSVRGARRSYDTIVSWRPVDGVEVYEAVWRDTTAADWEGAVLLSGEAVSTQRGRLTATLEGVCIDDVVVGLRCVGKDGSRSRVQTPPEPDAMAARGTRRRGR